MNIGIIVHSHTGNTLFVAQKLQEKLNEEGHKAVIEKIVVVDENPSINEVNLSYIPKVDSYDMVILAYPVRGFMVSPAMKAYLKNTSNFPKNKVGVLCTHHFPFAFLGGNQTINEMKRILSNNEVVCSGVVNWSSRKRQNNIDSLIKDFVEKIK